LKNGFEDTIKSYINTIKEQVWVLKKN
jgi:hypothetical protein